MPGSQPLLLRFAWPALHCMMPDHTAISSSQEESASCSTSSPNKPPPEPAHTSRKTKNRAVDTEDDYFSRRALRRLCTQSLLPFAEDFLPQASCILPSLYLCDLYTATSPSVLAGLGITHVVSVIDPSFSQSRAFNAIERTVEHYMVPIEDHPSANISDFFECACAWIDRALNGQDDAAEGRTDGEQGRETKVLVHCVWGMSRSASIVIAYLMAKEGMSLRQALLFVKARRFVVSPNEGFMDQLSAFEDKLTVRDTVDESSI